MNSSGYDSTKRTEAGAMNERSAMEAQRNGGVASRDCARGSPLQMLLATGTVFAMACLAHAQDLTVKAPPQREAIAIVNAVIHPVSSPTIEQGFLVFDGGRIIGIGEGELTTDQNVRIIDAQGRHIYPRFIGANTQIGLAEITAVRASNDHREVGDITPEVRAAVAVNPDSTLIPVTRTNGVLTVGTFPTGGRIPGRVSIMQLEGWTWEEMAVKQDGGLAINWPSMRAVTAWWMDRSESEQAEDSRQQHAAIDDAFDTAEAYLKARDADGNERRHAVDLRWEAMRGVLKQSGEHERQLPVYIAANELEQIISAVSWGVQRGLKVVIVGGRDAAEAADLLARHDVPVIITGTHTFPKRADSAYDEAFTLPHRLHEAGIRFAISSADRTSHERNLPYNAATAVAYGLDRDIAIRSLTLSAAEILGVEDELGCLSPGKRATFIMTSGDPLEIMTNVDMAFIEGREIDLSNKQSHLAEKYREKYRQLRAAE